MPNDTSLMISDQNIGPGVAFTHKINGFLGYNCERYASKQSVQMVDFQSQQSGTRTVQQWLMVIAAIEGLSRHSSRVIVPSLLEQVGLSRESKASMSSLSPWHKAAFALAEMALSRHNLNENAKLQIPVVVPEPPLPWPHRDSLRQLAVQLFQDSTLILHTTQAWELYHLVPQEAWFDTTGKPLRFEPGHHMTVRVWAEPDAYSKWKAALQEQNISLEGGPVSHWLHAPNLQTPREVLAMAYEAGVEVLEIKSLFTVAAHEIA